MYIIHCMFFLCYHSYVFLFFYHLILLLIVPGRWRNNLVFLHFSLHCELEVMFSFWIKMQQLQMFLFLSDSSNKWSTDSSIIKVIVSCSPKSHGSAPCWSCLMHRASPYLDQGAALLGERQVVGNHLVGVTQNSADDRRLGETGQQLEADRWDSWGR